MLRHPEISYRRVIIEILSQGGHQSKNPKFLSNVVMHEEGRRGGMVEGQEESEEHSPKGFAARGYKAGGREVEERNGITFIFESSVRFIG